MSSSHLLSGDSSASTIGARMTYREFDSWPAGRADLKGPQITVRLGRSMRSAHSFLGWAVQALGRGESLPGPSGSRLLPAAAASSGQQSMGCRGWKWLLQTKERKQSWGWGGDSTDVTTQPGDWMNQMASPGSPFCFCSSSLRERNPVVSILPFTVPILTQNFFPHQPHTFWPFSSCSTWWVHMRNGLRQTRSLWLWNDAVNTTDRHGVWTRKGCVGFGSPKIGPCSSNQFNMSSSFINTHQYHRYLSNINSEASSLKL